MSIVEQLRELRKKLIVFSLVMLTRVTISFTSCSTFSSGGVAFKSTLLARLPISGSILTSWQKRSCWLMETVSFCSFRLWTGITFPEKIIPNVLKITHENCRISHIDISLSRNRSYLLFTHASFHFNFSYHMLCKIRKQRNVDIKFIMSKNLLNITYFYGILYSISLTLDMIFVNLAT